MALLGRPPLGGGSHQVFRHDELRGGDKFRLDADHARSVELGKIDDETNLAVAEALERTTQALPTVDRLGELDLCLLARPTLDVYRPDERTVDARRGDLEPVAALDDVVGIEYRRQLARDCRALVDGDVAVLALGHDLDGVTIAAGYRNSDESETKLLQDRLRELGNAPGKPCLAAESSEGHGLTCRSTDFPHGSTAGHRNPMAQNKKSGPEGSLSKLR